MANLNWGPGRPNSDYFSPQADTGMLLANAGRQQRWHRWHGAASAPSKTRLGCLASFLEEFCWVSSAGIILLSWETVVPLVRYASGQNL